ncbi:DUF5406 family protein [Enterococcus faecium]|uniref:DUF5406 family protein n=3 Tax=Enterococcus faecium TaxID=1352 RepID=UPI0006ACCA16|nr:DUF5406 family protein [Enterococcus faecium]
MRKEVLHLIKFVKKTVAIPDVLALDEDDLYDQTLTDNPIGFGLLPEDDEGNEWFKMTLMNDNGDELSVEDTWSYLSDYIVSFEIIEFVADKEE